MLITNVCHAHLQLPVIAIGVLTKKIYEFLMYDLLPLKRPNLTSLATLFKGPDVPTEVPM